jgi:predicted GH43/DUF377 family glycosyl hydrolase
VIAITGIPEIITFFKADIMRQPRVLKRSTRLLVLTVVACGWVGGQSGDSAEVPVQLRRWLQPQQWQRDTDGPVVSLGAAGEFDDTHIFAPCVARDDGRYRLWYSGSRGTVARRVFALGLATSDDGRHFERCTDNPVFRFGDDRSSILTATLLRDTAGRPIREDGRLRLWFSATDFAGGSGVHTLHESTSSDGLRWSSPSPPQLRDVYAPTIIRDGASYHIWYTDVAREPWVFRHATSRDGSSWTVDAAETMVVDQSWEQRRLFYPTVVQADGVYLMWYGSYWAAHASKTAIGFAVSADGREWHKHPANPVLRPDPARPWESHYTTSQSVMRLPDGSWRIWYASRKQPPFVNKYFAIGTATWSGPKTDATP